MTRRTLLLAAAMLPALHAWSARADTAPLRIGVNFELTGAISSYGQHALVSARIAVEEINKAGGVDGAPIELTIEDNKSSPEQAVIATRNLADKGVIAMLGPVTTTVVRTGFPATNRAEMPAISPGSGAPGWARRIGRGASATPRSTRSSSATWSRAFTNCITTRRRWSQPWTRRTRTRCS